MPPDPDATIRKLSLEYHLDERQLREIAAQLAPTVRLGAPAISSPVLADSFGKYALIEKLGEGGFGAVWLAHDGELKRAVALKIAKITDPDDLARFKREATLAAQLRHPNIAPVFEVGELGGQHYLAMEYIEGGPPKPDELEPLRAVEIVRDAARAVHYAHERGIIHRDLKPANLMVDPSGRVVVLDFGLAKKSEGDSSISASGIVVGTPAYMPPEQAEGHVHLDAKADVYSLGATLYHLAVGVIPFPGKAAQVIRKVVEEEPIPPRRLRAELPRDVETIIVKAMAKEPAKRYATAAELADDLGRWLAGEPILARPATRLERAWKRVKRNPVPYGLAAALVLGALGLAAWFGGGAVWRAATLARLERDGTRALEGAGDWRRAMGLADRGLKLDPEHAGMAALRNRARAQEIALAARAQWDGRTPMLAEIRRLEVELRALEDEIPSHAPPSERRERLWPTEDNLQEHRLKLERTELEARQQATEALRLDPRNAAARRLLAEIHFGQWGVAADAPSRAFHEAQVRRYGGDDLLRAATAPVLVAITTSPAGARAYLFGYRERGRRLAPVPLHPERGEEEIEWPDVDPLPLDAPDEEVERIRAATAYPLAASDHNRIDLPVDLPPGSYLILFRHDETIDVRFPLLVERGAAVEGEVWLPAPADVPEGCLYIPAGPYIAGNDPDAADWTGEGRHLKTDLRTHVDGFFIARYSVTTAQYAEFLNDREFHTLEEAWARTPRNNPDGGQYAERDSQRIEISTMWNPDEPMCAISWEDAKAYAAWYTLRHGRGRWEFRLPTEDEWEKAARGVDGRYHVWGDRFDPGFCGMQNSRPAPRPTYERIGLFPADESPYGVRDMAGVTRDWTSTEAQAGQWRIVKGGYWGADAVWCRAAYRDDDTGRGVLGAGGLRLAASRVLDF